MSVPALQTEPHRRQWTKAEYYRLGDLGYFRGQKVELLAGEIYLQYPADHRGVGLPYPSEEPHPRLWTKEEYYRLGEQGFFNGQKAELIEGIIVVTSPQGPAHYSTLKRVGRVLGVHLPGYDVRTQGPLDLGLHTEPEPDVAVVFPSPDDYATAHPRTALLVVEVSDTTVASDRTDKASLYARGNIADYWIVNIADGQVEVYRDPGADATQPHGHGYATTFTLKPPMGVSPLAAPGGTIPVADLLP